MHHVILHGLCNFRRLLLLCDEFRHIEDQAKYIDRLFTIKIFGSENVNNKREHIIQHQIDTIYTYIKPSWSKN